MEIIKEGLYLIFGSLTLIDSLRILCGFRKSNKYIIKVMLLHTFKKVALLTTNALQIGTFFYQRLVKLQLVLFIKVKLGKYLPLRWVIPFVSNVIFSSK